MNEVGIAHRLINIMISMCKKGVIARTYSGAIDLYQGTPDLLKASVVDVEYDNSYRDYRTTLVLKDVKGNLHRIEIADCN